MTWCYAAAASRGTHVSRPLRILSRTVRKDHARCATLPPMITRRTMAALAASISVGCGPTHVTITTTGADEGEAADTDGTTTTTTTGSSLLGSTGLGGTDSGLDPGTDSGGQSSGSFGSSSDTGGGSSSTGGPPPVCLAILNEAGAWACYCDGLPYDPIDCGCHDDPIGWCTCPAGAVNLPCVGGCGIVNGSCLCNGVIVDNQCCGAAGCPGGSSTG